MAANPADATAPDPPGLAALPSPEWYFEHVLAYARPDGLPTRSGPAAQWSRYWAGLSADRAHRDAAARQLAARHGFTLRPGEVATLGLSREQVRNRIRRGDWVSAGRGFVVPAPIAAGDHEGRRRRHAVHAAAAARSRPGDVLSATSAAILHGLPTRTVPQTPQLTTIRGWVGPRTARHSFCAALDAAECARWYGLPVTAVPRTLVDLGRHDRWDAIMAADAALRERLVTTREIDRALSVARGWPGIRQARRILALADPRSESPLESALRLALHDDGFPYARPQVEIAGYRVDLLIEEWTLVLEADGRSKYGDLESVWKEKRREDVVRRHVRAVERVIWSDVFGDWPATAARLRAHRPRP